MLEHYLKQLEDLVGEPVTLMPFKFGQTSPSPGLFQGYLEDIGKINDEWVIRLYTNNSSANMVASFNFSPFPGCCAFLVSNAAWVRGVYQGKGVGSLMNKLRIHLARELGYASLICTDVDTNIRQRKILKKNGWKDIHTVTNPRTLNLVHISIIDL